MTTPSPGRGWRWLRVGAKKREGDEFPIFFKNRKMWLVTNEVGTFVTTNAHHTYRRRVKKGKR